MKLEEYPGVSSYTDGGGKTRWRYQKKGKATSLPGQPGDDAFDAKYRELTGARVIRFSPTGSGSTFRQAWKMIEMTADYQDLDDDTKTTNWIVIRSFLDLPVIEDEPLLWGDVPVTDMTADDVEMLKGRYPNAPTRPKRIKSLLRKIFTMARRKNWRPDDPTDLVVFKKGSGRNGNYIGHKPWPPAICAQFEARHPIGTPARTCYTLAKWIGNRREDVATLDWEQLQEIEVEIDGEFEVIEAFVFEQSKQVASDEDMTQYRPYSAMLREALEPIRKASGPVLVSPQNNRAYSVKGLSDMMRFWCEQAGIPKGWRLHGLRKSYAVALAESGATPRHQMDMLGHVSMTQAVYYSRGADKRKTTATATRMLEAQWRRQGGGRPTLVKK